MKVKLEDIIEVITMADQSSEYFLDMKKMRTIDAIAL